MTRVELHAATREQYDRLHELMRGAGFHTVIDGTDGNWHQLPTAEYYYSGNDTIEAVRAAAAQCAAAVVPRYWVLVTEYTNCAWIGLPAVARAA
jgi:hypothetical protein